MALRFGKDPTAAGDNRICGEHQSPGRCPRMERFLVSEACRIGLGQFTVPGLLVDCARKDMIRRDADLFQQREATRTLARKNENWPVARFSGSDR